MSGVKLVVVMVVVMVVVVVVVMMVVVVVVVEVMVVEVVVVMVVEMVVEMVMVEVVMVSMVSHRGYLVSSFIIIVITEINVGTGAEEVGGGAITMGTGPSGSAVKST